MSRRPLRLPLLCVIAIVASLGLAGSAHAAPSPVLAQGTLTDVHGSPAPGTVDVYAWPRRGDGSQPLVGHAEVAADGGYMVVANDPRRLARLARRGHGLIDLRAMAHSGARRGESLYTVGVERSGNSVRVKDQSDDTVASAAAFLETPKVDITADAAEPRGATASSAAADRCVTKRQVKRSYAPKYTVVGELNNAYNDGTSARFVYGTKGGTTTRVGFAVGVEGSSGSVDYRVTKTNKISSGGSVSFPAVRRRYSRKMLTKFRYERTKVRNATCAKYDYYVRAVEFLGGHASRKVKGRLDRCIPEQSGEYERGSRFSTVSTKGGSSEASAGARYAPAVSIFGADLTSETAWSSHVSVRYRFKGPRSYKHYVCAKNGYSSASTGGIVTTGKRPGGPH